MKAPRLFAYCLLCDVSESLITLMTLAFMAGWLMMSGTLSTTTMEVSRPNALGSSIPILLIRA